MLVTDEISCAAKALLAFDPQFTWIAGSYDADALVAAFQTVAAFQPFRNEHGPQAAFRLDVDPDQPDGGYWLSHVQTATDADIDAAIAAYTPPQP